MLSLLDTGRWNVRRQQLMPGKKYLTRQGRTLYVKTIFIGSSFVAQSNNTREGFSLFIIGGVKKYPTEEIAQAALDRYAAELRLIEVMAKVR